MEWIIKKIISILACFLFCNILTSCGKKSEPAALPAIIEETAATEISADTQPVNSNPAPVIDSFAVSQDRLIENQTFETAINPLGDVTFASYLPNTGQDAMADAIFTVEKDGTIICTLTGIYENNIRSNESFSQVEAVSFPDYNNDGFEDIIILCSYIPASESNIGIKYLEGRIYSGNADGNFTYEKELSEKSNSALEEKNIYTILAFLDSNWQRTDEPNDDI